MLKDPRYKFSNVCLWPILEHLWINNPDWGFSVLFLSFKANARVKLAKSGHGPHLFKIVICVVLVIVLCYCLYAILLLLCYTVIVLRCYYLCYPMYWSCVLYHCHRVLTQLQSTNISIYLSLKRRNVTLFPCRPWTHVEEWRCNVAFY